MLHATLGFVVTALFLALALILAAPAIVDSLSWLLGLLRRRGRSEPPGAPDSERRPHLLFLIPAHDEEELIGRTVRSLLDQEYPADRRTVAVVADNCRDRTASRAADSGADVVLERRSADRRGKQHALAWGMQELGLEEFAAVVIIDADTVVDPDFAIQLSRWAPLDEKLIQARVGATNERENWLTRMASVLTLSRWDIALPLKERANLNCPLTGDGTVIGTEILLEHPWRIETITEGWELYARYTLAGYDLHYEPRARLYAQEARSLDQSKSQRERWTAGRLAVLRLYFRDIIAAPGLRVLQKLDLIAELSSVGPVMRAFLGLLGMAIAMSLQTAAGVVIGALYLSPLVRTGWYAAMSIARHPEPVATIAAFLRLPTYVVWRVLVGLRSFFLAGTDRWVRTERHREAEA